jgi:uncharacterized membrane protein YidH (DUF202 family)
MVDLSIYSYVNVYQRVDSFDPQLTLKRNHIWLTTCMFIVFLSVVLMLFVLFQATKQL